MLDLSPPDFAERLRVVIDCFNTRREAAETAGVSLDAIIRYLRGENQPGFGVVARLCHAAEISMHWLATGEGARNIHETLPNHSALGIPVIGLAETDQTGWYQAQPSRIQTTLDLPDPKAFATVVHGQALIPEGLQPGFLCVCSPMLRPVMGDIIHLRRHDGLCAIRLFIREEGEWLVLRAYTDPDTNGTQRVYEDKVKRSVINEIAPVVFVRRKV